MYVDIVTVLSSCNTLKWVKVVLSQKANGIPLTQMP